MEAEEIYHLLLLLALGGRCSDALAGGPLFGTGSRNKYSFIGLVFIASGQKVSSTSSTGATEVFEVKGRLRRTGMLVDDFDVTSTWEWSFEEFVVTEDLEMRLTV